MDPSLLMNTDPVIAAVACTASAAIFAGSATMKFVAPAEFRGAVENYRIVPEWMAGAIAWIVPVLELAGAAAMMLAASRGAGSMLLLLLIAAFSGAIAINLARGRREIDCGCFGPLLRQRLSGWLLARNGLLALLIVVSDLPRDSRPLSPLDYATVISAAATFVILYAAANYLIANAPTSAALRTIDA